MLFYTICLFFVIYGSIESFGLLVRYGGYLASDYSYSVVLANQIYSLNRFNGFLIPPLLGLYVDMGASANDLKNLSKLGLFGVAAMTTIIMIARIRIASAFKQVLVHFSEFGFVGLAGWRKAFNSLQVSYRMPRNRAYVWLPLFAQSFVSFTSLSAVFVINILSIEHGSWSTTILQSTTLISGLGNLVLNFYVLPAIARLERKGAADVAYLSVMSGKILGAGVFAICIVHFI